jgi:hypothetical protein
MEFLRTLPHRLLDEYHAPFAITIKCSLPQEPAVPPRTGKGTRSNRLLHSGQGSKPRVIAQATPSRDE